MCRPEIFCLVVAELARLEIVNRVGSEFVSTLSQAVRSHPNGQVLTERTMTSKDWCLPGPLTRQATFVDRSGDLSTTFEISGGGINSHPYEYKEGSSRSPDSEMGDRVGRPRPTRYMFARKDSSVDPHPVSQVVSTWNGKQ